MYRFALIAFWFALQTGDLLARDDVLLLVNDLMPAEHGTGNVPAGQFVAGRYAARRGVTRILHLRTTAGESVSWDQFDATIRRPVREYLSAHDPEDNVQYIVPTYGIPLKLRDLPVPAPPNLTQEGYSVDLFLASLRSEVTAAWTLNPYRAYATDDDKLPFRYWTNPYGWKMYLVTRLDGPDALVAAALVDRAIAGEESLTKSSGVGYYDFQNRGCGEDQGGYCSADLSMRRAFDLSQAAGFRSVLNDQSKTGSMFKEAPDTLWAWGWYSKDTISGKYTFVPGAVGAQLTSFTAKHIRKMGRGTWVPLWLEAGVTATWGATEEPYTHGYAPGDILLSRIWRGYNFAEAAYQALPQLNWMMVFVGDPLYAPKSLRCADETPPVISELRVESTGGGSVIRWRTDEPADSRVGDTHAPALVRFHSIAVRDAAGSVAVQSRDRCGNLAERTERLP